jgi:hypothetical protein
LVRLDLGGGRVDLRAEVSTPAKALTRLGFTAAFLVMLFPKNLGSIADLYGAVVTGLEDEADEQDGDKEWRAVAKEREGKYRARFLKCMVRVQRNDSRSLVADTDLSTRGV